MKLKLNLILTILILVVPSLVIAGTHERRGWYIGFGLGGGNGSMTVEGEEATFDEILEGFSASARSAINFKVGGTVNPKLLVGLDITSLTQTASLGTIINGTLQLNNTFAMATFFPVEKGFFLRGGGGFTSATLEGNALWSSGSMSETGVGFLGGVGYAFWLGKSFNMTINLDIVGQSYGDELDSTRFTLMYLGFDWY